MPPNGWDGIIYSIANGCRSHVRYFLTIGRRPSATMTSQLQIFDNMQDKLTFLLEDSLVSRTAQRASAKEKTMIVTSGPTCYDVFAKSNRAGLWAKMFSALLLGTEGWYSRRCVLTLKLKVTPYSRLFFQLQPSTLRTEEIGCGLLPTPKLSDGKGGVGKGVELRNGSYRTVRPSGIAYGANIRDVVGSGMLPTPKAQEARGNASVDRGKYNLTDEVAARYKPTSKTSQLNPRFVAEMMGFPPNWTELPFQSGEPNQSRVMETP